MPSGRVHTITTLALAVGSVISGQDTALTVGIMSGLVISPDLDVDDGFIGLAHLRKLPAGNIISKCWQWFWLPYSKLVPHRSHISHSIFFGTCARVGYMAVPLLALNFFGVPMKLPTDTGQWFIGLCMADALHIILDNTVKGK